MSRTGGKFCSNGYCVYTGLCIPVCLCIYEICNSRIVLQFSHWLQSKHNGPCTRRPTFADDTFVIFWYLSFSFSSPFLMVRLTIIKRRAGTKPLVKPMVIQFKEPQEGDLLVGWLASVYDWWYSHCIQMSVESMIITDHIHNNVWLQFPITIRKVGTT